MLVRARACGSSAATRAVLDDGVQKRGQRCGGADLARAYQFGDGGQGDPVDAAGFEVVLGRSDTGGAISAENVVNGGGDAGRGLDGKQGLERSGAPAGLFFGFPGGCLGEAFAWFGAADRDFPAQVSVMNRCRHSSSTRRCSSVMTVPAPGGVRMRRCSRWRPSGSSTSARRMSSQGSL